MKLFFAVFVVAACQLVQSKEKSKREILLKTGSNNSPLKITFPVFSGRSDNPTWSIPSNNEHYARIRELLADARSNGFTYKPERMPAVLGYKGFLVREQTDSSLPLVVGPETKELQGLLLRTIPRGFISETVKTAMLQTIQSGRISAAHAQNVEKRCICCGINLINRNRHGPALEYNSETLRYWNQNCNRRQNTNCYNYATNIVTRGGQAEPGRTTDVPNDPNENYGELIKERAIRDGLTVIELEDDDALPEVRTGNEDKNVVALFVQPLERDERGHKIQEPDYHWYRLDRNRHADGNYYWSHKPGRDLVTNLDKSWPVGHEILNPRNANTGAFNYEFVCFMEVDKNRVIKKIGAKCTQTSR